jgi:uncharacterized RDD family membrane protein YckC
MELRSAHNQYQFAGFWRRLAAGIIDMLILSILPVAWIAVAVVIFGPPVDVPEASAFDQLAGVQQVLDSQRASHLSQQQRLAGWASNIFSVAFVIGFWTWKGQTPGKMLFKIRIIRKDGQPLSLWHSTLRYVGQLIGLTLFFLGILMIAWDSKRQGLHDKIAGTYVIKL